MDIADIKKSEADMEADEARANAGHVVVDNTAK